jgi:nitrous-oxide reductase
MMGYLLVKDPNKKYKSVKKIKLKKMSKEDLMKEYKKTVALNEATKKVIQSVVKFLKENHYEKYPVVKQLVEDALDQYSKVADEEKKAEEALKKGDIDTAINFQYQAWQYLVKTADVGIRAKDLLVKKLATPMSEAAKRGEAAFAEGGCGGCHVIGKVSSGPDLVGVLQRHENGEKWVADFIKDPSKYYNDPYVKAMIDYFNLRMPNQHMSDQEIKDIIEYLKWVDENAHLF